MSFNGISHRWEDEWDIRHFSWDLHSGERAWIKCSGPEQYEVLWRILQRNLKPKEGRVEEIHQVFTYTDDLIVNRLDRKANMYQALKSKLFEESVWIGGHRVLSTTLIDRLQIDIASRRLPLEEISEKEFNRFWAILFVTTKAKLLLSRSLFYKLDELSANLIKQWSQDFLGGLIVLGDEKAPFQFKTSINIAEDGAVKINKEAQN